MCECKQGKKALLTGYVLDPHFYDLKNLATKKSNSQKCVDEGIKGDEHVKATQE